MALSYSTVRSELVQKAESILWPILADKVCLGPVCFGAQGKLHDGLNSLTDAQIKQGIVEASKGLSSFTAWFTSSVTPTITSKAQGHLTASDVAKVISPAYNILSKYVGAVQVAAAEADPSWWTDETAALTKVASTGTKKTTSSTGTPSATTSTTSSVLLPLLAVGAVAFLLLK